MKFNRDLINGFVSYSVLKFGQKIIDLVQMDQQSDFPLTDCILVVGGGNGEYILELDGDLEIGQKNLARSRSLIGGGGINQTLRLLKAGYSPLPILPLGHDLLGQKIHHELLQEYQLSSLGKQVLDYISNDNFLVRDLKTRLSTIVIHQQDRTIFTEKTTGLEHFYPHLVNRLQELDEAVGDSLKAIAIGDISADAFSGGQCTQYLLERFSRRCLIFANPGKGQLGLAPSFWQEYLNRINILQLNILEVKYLFTHIYNVPHPSLFQLLDWLYQGPMNTVITCDHYGVLGIYPKEPEKIIFAPPINLTQTIDTTGAGDAFGAGLVSRLYRSGFSFLDFYGAIDEARVWAAYACCYVGGSADCPNPQQLKDFKNSRLKVSEEVEVLDHRAIKPILRLLEKIYCF